MLGRQVSLEKWLLNLEANSVEHVTNSSLNLSLSLGLTHLERTTLLIHCHVVYISVADSKMLAW